MRRFQSTQSELGGALSLTSSPTLSFETPFQPIGPPCNCRTGQLLNVNDLAKSLQANRLTIAQCLSFLESVYLVRRINAWHNNQSKRLIRAPKIYFINSGLAAMVTDIPTEDWNEARVCVRRLLESFVIQQFITQAGWTNPDLKIWQYRDKDQVEVDAVLTLGIHTWGIEVKLTSTPKSQHQKGLRRLVERSGKNFQQGIL